MNDSNLSPEEAVAAYWDLPLEEVRKIVSEFEAVRRAAAGVPVRRRLVGCEWIIEDGLMQAFVDGDVDPLDVEIAGDVMRERNIRRIVADTGCVRATAEEAYDWWVAKKFLQESNAPLN
jgi:hypothetical protein